MLLCGTSGCVTVTRYPELYPDNEAARAMGPLTATLVGHGNLSGTITTRLPTGEVLSGRYSIIANGGAAMGTASGSAYGSGGYASGSASSYGVGISARGNGEADMIGAHGTTAHCGFDNNNFSGHGNGICELSTGARYRMQY